MVAPGTLQYWLVLWSSVFLSVKAQEFCNGRPSTFQPICSRGGSFTVAPGNLDWKKCVKRQCPTSTQQGPFSLLPSVASVEPADFVLVGNNINLTCQTGFRMEGDSDADKTFVPGTNPKSWIQTCTRSCTFSNPPFCKPLVCYSPGRQAYRNSVMSPVLDDVGFEYVYGQHPIFRTTCNAGYMAREGNAERICSKTFDVKCEDSGQMTKNDCIPLWCNASSILSGQGVVDPNANATVPLQRRITVGCLPGYRYGSGDTSAPTTGTVTCLDSCTWDPPWGGCQKISCSNWATITGGTLSPGMPTIRYEESVTVTCEAGTIVDGAGCSSTYTATCGTDGTLRNPRGGTSAPTCISTPTTCTAARREMKEAQAEADELEERDWHRSKSGRRLLQTCGVYNPPNNSAVSPANWQQLQTMTVTCNQGLVEQSSLVRSFENTCSGGVWSGSGKQCVATCPAAQNVVAQVNSVVRASGLVLAGERVAASCRNGHRAVSKNAPFSVCTDNSTLSAVCGSDGTLSHQCKPVSCGTFNQAGPPGRYTMRGSGPTLFGDIAEVTCNRCYRANLRQRYSAKCGADCQFYSEFSDFTIPVDCTLLNCGLWRVPDYATVIDSKEGWNESYPLICGEKKIRIQCETGRIRSTSTESKCEPAWDVYCGHENALIIARDDFCMPLQCARLSLPSFNSITANSESFVPDAQTSPGQGVVVTCQEGFRATVSRQASCLDPQSFTATCTNNCGYATNNLTCQRVTCSLALTDNIDRDPLSFPYVQIGETAPLQCSTGHRFDSTDHTQATSGVSTCTTSCQFQPACQPVLCSAYTVPAFARLVATNTMAQESVQLSFGSYRVECEEGYVVHTSVAPDCPSFFNVQCQDNGEMLGTHFFCVNRTCDCPGAGFCVPPDITCGVYTPPANAEVIDPIYTADPTKEYVYGEKVRARCKAGYVLTSLWSNSSCGRNFVDTCSAVGKFQGQLAIVCQPLKCSLPTTATGLILDTTESTIGFGETVTMTCRFGFAPTPEAPLVATCTQECKLDQILSCVEGFCPFFNGFDYSVGVKPVASLSDVPYGGTVTIECDDDYMLDDGETTAIPNLHPDFAAAELLHYASLPASITGQAMSLGPIFGEWGQMSITVPSFGWPAGETRPLTAGVISIPAGVHPPRGSKMTFASTVCFDFQPEGATFLRPITVALPYNSSLNPAQYRVSVHKYDPTAPNLWVEQSPPSGAPLLNQEEGTVSAQLRSFSIYTSIAINIETSGGGNTANDTNTGGDGNGDGGGGGDGGDGETGGDGGGDGETGGDGGTGSDGVTTTPRPTTYDFSGSVALEGVTLEEFFNVSTQNAFKASLASVMPGVTADRVEITSSAEFSTARRRLLATGTTVGFVVSGFASAADAAAASTTLEQSEAALQADLQSRGVSSLTALSISTASTMTTPPPTEPAVVIPPIGEEGSKADGLSIGIGVGIGVVACLVVAAVASRCIVWKDKHTGHRALVLDKKTPTADTSGAVEEGPHGADDNIPAASVAGSHEPSGVLVSVDPAIAAAHAPGNGANGVIENVSVQGSQEIGPGWYDAEVSAKREEVQGIVGQIESMGLGAGHSRHSKPQPSNFKSGRQRSGESRAFSTESSPFRAQSRSAESSPFRAQSRLGSAESSPLR